MNGMRVEREKIPFSFSSIFDEVRAGNKPGSVPLQHHQGSNSRTIQPLSWLKRGAATIYLGLMLPSASSILPDRRAGHPKAILFGLAAGGVCTAGPVTRTAVGSYPAISPLPVTSQQEVHRRYVFCCTFHRFTPSGR